MSIFNFRKEEPSKKEGKSFTERAADGLEVIKQLAEDCHDRRSVFINIMSVPDEDNKGMNNMCLVTGSEVEVEDIFLASAMQNPDFKNIILNVADKIKGKKKSTSRGRRKLDELMGRLPDNMSAATLDMNSGELNLPDDMPEEIKNALRGLRDGKNPLDSTNDDDLKNFNDDLDELDD